MLKKSNSFPKEKIIFCMIICAVFICMLALNFLTPYLADDFTYALEQTSLSEAFQKEYQQYHHWGGRSVVHILLRLFLLMPKGVFNVFNSAVFTLLIYVIYKISAQEKAYNSWLFLFVAALLWLYAADFGSTILWETGACNYLWGTAIVVAFLYPYIYYLDKKTGPGHPTVFATAIFVLGVLAGWCNENTSAGGILLAVGLIAVAKIHRGKWQLWHFTGLAGALLGFLLMITAPGNRVRAGGGTVLSQLFSWETLYARVSTINTDILTYFLPLLLLAAVSVVLQLCFSKGKDNDYTALLFLLASFVTWYAMVASPQQPIRSYFGANIFLIIALCRSLFGLPFGNAAKTVKAIVLTLIFAQTTLSLPPVLLEIVYFNSLTREQERCIQLYKSKAITDVIVSDLPHAKYSQNPLRLDRAQADKDYWINQGMAEFYHISSIRSVPRDKWKAVYQNADTDLLASKTLEEYLATAAQKDYSLLFTWSGYSPAAAKEYDAFLQLLGNDGSAQLTGAGQIAGFLHAGGDQSIMFSDGEAIYSTTLHEADYSATAGKPEQASEILRAGLNLSVSGPGLNILVLNSEMQPVDSVCFSVADGTLSAQR